MLRHTTFPASFRRLAMACAMAIPLAAVAVAGPVGTADAKDRWVGRINENGTGKHRDLICTKVIVTETGDELTVKIPCDPPREPGRLPAARAGSELSEPVAAAVAGPGGAEQPSAPKAKAYPASAYQDLTPPYEESAPQSAPRLILR
jgi:hypothetical protein